MAGIKQEMKPEVKKEQQLIVSISPHIKSDESVSKIMWTVNLALLPALIMGVYFFGPLAAYIVLLCIISCVAFEAITQKLLNKKVTINDGSAFLTGLLLGMNLPPSLPFYAPIIGSFMAIVITKQLFGGLGYNIFNPALIGRAVLLVSWPRAMTTWNEPTAGFIGLDAVTTATPLSILKLEGLGRLTEEFGTRTELYIALFTGNVAGSIGETSAAAILIGGLFLIHRGYITWHIPISFIGTVAVLAWIFGGLSGGYGGLFSGDPIVHILSGGVMLGAFFMATDYVTSPAVKTGQLIFGAGCGALTMVIRLAGGPPEGVMFAIILMNCFAPLIDRSFKTQVFGNIKQKQ